jgi:hypothetical protein
MSVQVGELDEIEDSSGVRRKLVARGFIQRVKLSQLAQMAISEKVRIFYSKLGRRSVLVTYKSDEVQGFINGEAHFVEAISVVLYTILPARSGYKRCLVYNHGRGILLYQNLEVNGSEQDQNAKTDPVPIEGTQTLFVFDYPCEEMDLIMLLIKEHEIRGKNAFKKKPACSSQLRLEDFTDT